MVLTLTLPQPQLARSHEVAPYLPPGLAYRKNGAAPPEAEERFLNLAPKAKAALLPGAPHPLSTVDLATFFRQHLTAAAWKWCATVSQTPEKRQPLLSQQPLIGQYQCPIATVGQCERDQLVTLANDGLSALTLPEALWLAILGKIVFGRRYFGNAMCRTTTHSTRNGSLCVGWWQGKIHIIDAPRQDRRDDIGMAGKIVG